MLTQGRMVADDRPPFCVDLERSLRERSLRGAVGTEPWRGGVPGRRVAAARQIG